MQPEEEKNWVILAKQHEKGQRVNLGAPFYGPDYAGYVHRLNGAGLYTEAAAKAEVDRAPGCKMKAYRLDSPELRDYLAHWHPLRAAEFDLFNQLRATAPVLPLLQETLAPAPLADAELAELVALYQQLSPKPLLALDPQPETGEVIILEETRRNVVTWLCTMASQSGNMEGWAKLFASSINALPGLLARLAKAEAAAALPLQYKQERPAPSDEVQAQAYKAAIEAEGWTLRALEGVSEGSLSQACFDAGLALGLAAATPVATAEPAGAGYEKLKAEMLRYVACNPQTQDEVFVRFRAMDKTTWTRAEFVEALRNDGPVALDMMVSLMGAAAYLITQDKDFPKALSATPVATVGSEPAASGWISVNERLPEPTIWKRDMPNGVITQATHTQYWPVAILRDGEDRTDIGIYETHKGQWTDVQTEKPLEFVTHWQPLPAPLPDEAR